ncbi:MAG: tRNA dihydrouridine synthase DusB [Coriobacteriales bacterium]|jgi:nifR3 family TIM-barrel protein|nr:tRNA dihydrouridine synthase DusB [Coriobacteriales bacterium]
MLFDDANKLLLAPMAGVNDPVFRLICKEMGAQLTYTEMVSAKGLEYDNRKTQRMLFALEAEGSVAVQLFGRDAQTLARQAAQLEQDCGDQLALIDINMACPVRKLVTRGEGAALLSEPELAERILQAVCAAVGLPVTVKIRKGLDSGQDTAVEFARRAEQCGVAAVAVHGRTAAQLYHGSADRAIVGRVAAALRIPVIASGDVFTRADAEDYLQHYGARAVMVARGAQGNPWIFSGSQKNVKIAVEERVRVANRHTVELAALFPERLSSMRKHIAWYFRGTPHATAIRRAVNQCVCLRDYEALFEQILIWRD